MKTKGKNAISTQRLQFDSNQKQSAVVLMGDFNENRSINLHESGTVG